MKTFLYLLCNNKSINYKNFNQAIYQRRLIKMKKEKGPKKGKEEYDEFDDDDYNDEFDDDDYDDDDDDEDWVDYDDD